MHPIALTLTIVFLCATAYLSYLTCLSLKASNYFSRASTAFLEQDIPLGDKYMKIGKEYQRRSSLPFSQGRKKT